MEYGIAPVKNIMVILLAACVLLASPVLHADEQHIVIVADARSLIKSISAKDARRAFLGATIVVNGVEIKPLLNQTNKLTEEVFLQKVLFMSEEAYERQMLARAFRSGNFTKFYDNLNDLLAALRNDNAAITFMLHDKAILTPGIRIIGNQ